MVSQLFAVLNQVLTAVFGFFESVMTDSGLLPVFLGVFSAIMVIRFIVLPLIGGGTGGTRDSKKGGDGD